MKEKIRFINQLGFREGMTVKPTKDYNRLMNSFIVAKILFIDRESGLLYIDSPVGGRKWIAASWCVPIEDDDHED